MLEFTLSMTLAALAIADLSESFDLSLNDCVDFALSGMYLGKFPEESTA